MKLVVQCEVNRSPADLFDLSQDYRRRLEWDTYLDAAYLMHGAGEAAIGGESYCKSRGGSVMVSRYVSFRPPHVAAVTMVQGPSLLSSFSGTWEFKAQATGGTEVRFIYNFRLRPAWLRPVLEPLVAWIYRAQMRRRLAAFRQWAEGMAGAMTNEG